VHALHTPPQRKEEPRREGQMLEQSAPLRHHHVTPKAHQLVTYCTQRTPHIPLHLSCSVCDKLVLTAPEIQILKLLYSPPLLSQSIWQLFPSYTSHTASQKFITRAQWIRITCYFHQPPHFLLFLFLT